MPQLATTMLTRRMKTAPAPMQRLVTIVMESAFQTQTETTFVMSLKLKDASIRVLAIMWKLTW